MSTEKKERPVKKVETRPRSKHAEVTISSSDLRFRKRLVSSEDLQREKESQKKEMKKANQ